jgi:hypothetical protein
VTNTPAATGCLAAESLVISGLPKLMAQRTSAIEPILGGAIDLNQSAVVAKY